MDLEYQNKTIATDKDGYLKNLNDWSPEIAELIATNENIALSPAHWEVINALKQFYLHYELSPAMRPLAKYLSQQLGKDKSSSIYLLQLFPGSPAKIASKIAGLPRPTNCL